MSDYEQTRDAAGNITTYYNKMLRNLNDDLTCTGCGEYVGSPIANRIEELEEKLLSATMDGYDMAKHEYRDRIEELEAKLEKAMQIIEAYGEDEGYVPRRVVSLHEELKGQNSE